jgi:hypothetical protein
MSLLNDLREINIPILSYYLYGAALFILTDRSHDKQCIYKTEKNVTIKFKKQKKRTLDEGKYVLP